MAVARKFFAALIAATGALASSPAVAAGAGAENLSLAWGVPFAGMLLSIALLPLLAPSFWHHHYGKVAAVWSLAFLLPYALIAGPGQALAHVIHTLLAEYIPFILLLTALFTATGGILIEGNLRGTPLVNTALLGVGTGFASVMGTTGASMLLIRPLLRANDARKHRTHVVMFFIFLVANIGGSLTPLGDPPLFLGFLKGVDFFWTAKALFGPMLVSTAILLGVFYLLDSWYYGQREEELPADPTPDAPLKLEGWINFLLFGPLILLSVLMSGIWKPGIGFEVFGTPVELQNLVRDLLLVAITWGSLRFTSRDVRAANQFEWEPMLEVGKLFLGIFVTIIPVIAILRAGSGGAMAPLVALVTGP
ncbi:MAG: sodium:proton antiporter, partial [Burkholderiaceae bacterium]